MSPQAVQAAAVRPASHCSWPLPGREHARSVEVVAGRGAGSEPRFSRVVAERARQDLELDYTLADGRGQIEGKARVIAIRAQHRLRTVQAREDTAIVEREAQVQVACPV